MIKSFRGQLADDEIRTIRISTNDGMIGYRVVKFELFPSNPGSSAQESVVKVFTVDQTTATSTVDFAKGQLLVAGYLALNSAAYYGNDIITIFDNVVVNQDLTITHVDASGAIPVNYHLELEQIKLDLSEATVATLKDMRGRE